MEIAELQLSGRTFPDQPILSQSASTDWWECLSCGRLFNKPFIGLSGEIIEIQFKGTLDKSSIPRFLDSSIRTPSTGLFHFRIALRIRSSSTESPRRFQYLGNCESHPLLIPSHVNDFNYKYAIATPTFESTWLSRCSYRFRRVIGSHQKRARQHKFPFWNQQ